MTDLGQISGYSGAFFMSFGQSILVAFPQYQAYYVAGPSAINGAWRISSPVNTALRGLYDENLIKNKTRAQLLTPGQFGYAQNLSHNAGNAATLENAAALQAKIGNLSNLKYDLSGKYPQNNVTLPNGNTIRADISGNRYSLWNGNTVVLAESKGEKYLKGNATINQAARLIDNVASSNAANSLIRSAGNGLRVAGVAGAVIGIGITGAKAASQFSSGDTRGGAKTLVGFAGGLVGGFLTGVWAGALAGSFAAGPLGTIGGAIVGGAVGLGVGIASGMVGESLANSGFDQVWAPTPAPGSSPYGALDNSISFAPSQPQNSPNLPQNLVSGLTDSNVGLPDPFSQIALAQLPGTSSDSYQASTPNFDIPVSEPYTDVITISDVPIALTFRYQSAPRRRPSLHLPMIKAAVWTTLSTLQAMETIMVVMTAVATMAMVRSFSI